jgi:hypothetical protein
MLATIGLCCVLLEPTTGGNQAEAQFGGRGGLSVEVIAFAPMVGVRPLLYRGLMQGVQGGVEERVSTF